MSEDEFDALLRRCTQRLSEITLKVPSLERADAPRRPARLSLDPAAEPREPAAVLTPPPEKPAPKPAPLEAHEEEVEVFPPVRYRPAETPRPALPRVQAPAAPPVTAPPPVRRRLAAPAAAAALALALVALGVWSSRRAPELTIPLDGADAMAVRPESGDVLVARGAEVTTVAPDGRITGRRTLEGAVAGLAWTPGSLWSVDGTSPEVTERRDGERPTVFHLNHVPSAVFARGQNLWTQERGGRAIHQYLVSRSILGALLQPLDLLEIPGIAPEAFAFDEAGALWVVDGQTRSLYELRAVRGAYKPVRSAALSPLLGPSGFIHGLTIDAGAVWLLSRPAGGASVLRRIPFSRLNWNPA